MTPKEEAERMVRYMAEWVYSLNRPPTLVEWLYDMAPQIEKSLAEYRATITDNHTRDGKGGYWDGWADGREAADAKIDAEKARAVAAERERDYKEAIATARGVLLKERDRRIAELEAALRELLGEAVATCDPWPPLADAIATARAALAAPANPTTVCNESTHASTDCIPDPASPAAATKVHKDKKDRSPWMICGTCYRTGDDPVGCQHCIVPVEGVNLDTHNGDKK